MFRDKVILAPMVRTGCLPMRLLSLRYGADLVYSPEIIDKGMIKCERVLNEFTGTIDYVKDDGSVFFSTCEEEKDRIIFQMGSSDPALAVQTQQMVFDDVAGWDLNCGCPKPFSIKGGMGAALLKTPQLLKDILTSLVSNSRGKPVTCKIRLLETPEKTVELVKMIEDTGVSAITVHCRGVNQGRNERAHWDALKAISQSLTRIPLIANGDIYSLDDGDRVKELSGASSIMIARGAQYNPSVFRRQGVLDAEIVGRDFLQLAMQTDTPFQLFKYTILPFFPHAKYPALRVPMQASKTYQEVCDILGQQEFYRDLMVSHRSKIVPSKTTRKSLFLQNDPKNDHFLPYIPDDLVIPSTTTTAIV